MIHKRGDTLVVVLGHGTVNIMVNTTKPGFARTHEFLNAIAFVNKELPENHKDKTRHVVEIRFKTLEGLDSLRATLDDIRASMTHGGRPTFINTLGKPEQNQELIIDTPATDKSEHRTESGLVVPKKP